MIRCSPLKNLAQCKACSNLCNDGVTDDVTEASDISFDVSEYLCALRFEGSYRGVWCRSILLLEFPHTHQVAV